jgi:Fic family protein
VKQIATGLKVSQQDLTRPLSTALKNGTIAKKGERNQSRYLPG